MIEIVKRGTKKQIECNECGSILKYSDEDICRTDINMCDPLQTSSEYIKCPVCNKRIYLKQTR